MNRPSPVAMPTCVGPEPVVAKKTRSPSGDVAASHGAPAEAWRRTSRGTPMPLSREDVAHEAAAVEPVRAARRPRGRARQSWSPRCAPSRGRRRRASARAGRRARAGTRPAAAPAAALGSSAVCDAHADAARSPAVMTRNARGVRGVIIPVRVSAAAPGTNSRTRSNRARQRVGLWYIPLPLPGRRSWAATPSDRPDPERAGGPRCVPRSW